MNEYADVSLTQENQPRFISSFPWCPVEMPADVPQGKHGVLKQTHTKEATDASLSEGYSGPLSLLLRLGRRYYVPVPLK